MLLLILIVSFLLGLALGSFCNVVIYRLHSGESPVRGRSKCPHCKHELASQDLIPLLSFVALRGRCRYCRKPISLHYPVVELAMGVLTLTMVLRFGVSVAAAVGIVLSAFYLIIFAYDLLHKLILDRVSVPAMVVALVGSLLLQRTFSSIVLGGILGLGFFLLQYLVSRGRWIGGGDIRLGAVLGLSLGWPLVVVAIIIAYFSGTIVALALIIGKRRTWSSTVPFGTFLSFGGIVTFLWGSDMLAWYLHGGFFDWFVRTFLRY